jgi:hypothetical protein
MIKKLLIGASALAFATVAQAQVVGDPKTVDLSNNHGSAINGPAFNTAINGSQADRSPAVSTPTLTLPNLVNIVTGTVFNTSNETAATSAVSTYDGSALVNNISAAIDAAVKLDSVGNKSAIDQDGAFNDADVNQAGGTRGWSVVDQNGTFNYADVKQVDSNANNAGASTTNAAYISQLSYQPQSLQGSFAKKNQATVDQFHTGNAGRNSAVILQGSMVNTVTAGGVGHSDNGSVTQYGSGNEALIEQGVGVWGSGLTVPESGNKATIIQGKAGDIGRGNNAIVQQKSNGTAYTEQYGNTNQAYVLQVSQAESNIKQDGNSNYAAVSQSGAFAFSNVAQYGTANSSFVNQSGDNTVSEIKQGSELSNSDKNFASVVQSVNNAKSYVTQGDTSANLGFPFGTVTYGGGNEAYVTQSNAQNSVNIVTQNGLLNQSVVKQ